MPPLKAFVEAIAKVLGEHVGKLIWSALFVGGPVVAWFASPTTYEVRITRLQAAGIVLALLLVIATVSGITQRAVRPRRQFHLTQFGARNLWGVIDLADGSVNAHFTMDFVVKNMGRKVLRLVSARIVRPRIRGHLVQTTIFSHGGTSVELQPDDACDMTVGVHYQKVENPPPDGDLDVVIAVANDEGYEQRLRVKLRCPQPRHPAVQPAQPAQNVGAEGAPTP